MCDSPERDLCRVLVSFFDTNHYKLVKIGRLVGGPASDTNIVYVSIQMHAKPELAHRLRTSKMRRNSTSLNSCQHDDINIVIVSGARRR